MQQAFVEEATQLFALPQVNPMRCAQQVFFNYDASLSPEKQRALNKDPTSRRRSKSASSWPCMASGALCLPSFPSLCPLHCYAPPQPCTRSAPSPLRPRG
jgi:hypothetical protein